MRDLFILSILSILFTVLSPGLNAADFSKLHASVDADDAAAHFDERARLVLEVDSQGTLGKFNGQNGIGFHTAGIAHLWAGIGVEEFNRALLDPEARVYANVGTDFQDVGFLCRRTGDYDFMLRGMVALTYRFKDRPDLIWPQTLDKIYHHFLNQTGGKVHLKNNLWLCGVHPETENHILMTEGSRYLTNQLRFHETGKPEFDNEANGMNAWLLGHLQEFLKTDFSEYNSHPYQHYAVMALQNIYEFAEDPRVKLAAEMVMNYLDMKFAVSSNGLRRYTPFRRQKVYKDRTDMLYVDSETQRFVIMAGNFQILRELPTPYAYDRGFDVMLPPALGKYRVPPAVLDLVIRKDDRPYYERFKHTGVEMYASSDSFLISGGGVWIYKFDAWTGQDSGWAIPTTLMPTRGGIDAANFIRINGHKEDKQRVNTCVAPGFACGLNPQIPSFIPESCQEHEGNWTFVDFTAERCPLKYGFYAVVYKAACDSASCRRGGNSFGFFEAAEPRMSFQEFKNRVLGFNGYTNFGSDDLNEYITTDNRSIQFKTITHSKYEWGIHALDGVRTETDLQKWPLAQGNVLTADGTGLVVFTNPRLRKRITLDDRDFIHPRRYESSY